MTLQPVPGDTQEAILGHLKALGSDAFVDVIVEHLRHRADYFDVIKGPPGADSGVDIEARQQVVGGDSVEVAVQCKRYSTQSISRSDVASFLDGMRRRSIRRGVIVSTATLSDSARSSCKAAADDGYSVEWRSWTGPELVRTLLNNTPGILQALPGLSGLIPAPLVLAQHCPSFEIVEPVEAAPNTFADRFYNGFPPTWADLERGFDIQRSLYAAPGGLRERVLAALASHTFKALAVLGVSGTGKTTLLRRLAYDTANDTPRV